jgi:thiopurine S-methyltransferase
MDTSYWLKRWDEGQLGFHTAQINPYLASHVEKLSDGDPKATRVLVPFAGKSRDMTFLAEKGHPVVGVEIAELAVVAYFEEQEIPYRRATMGAFDRLEGGGVTLLRGDFLALDEKSLGLFDAAYDRAALVAVDPPDRPAYVEKLTSLLRPGAKILLVGFEYDPKEMSGPPHPVNEADLVRLFADRFDIALLERRSILEEEPRFKEKGLTALAETAWLLSRRS